jgi:multimeric flavodoxin WrbA
MDDSSVIEKIMREYDEADIIVSVSPSYWADVPGQFKVFIDRCTPWCNTHEPHAAIKSGKKGYTIALRTGPNMPECERIISTIEHFYGHLDIESVAQMGLTSIEYKEDVEPRKKEIIDFCRELL